ncbi:3'(2'),5'-bisphosphate nucleotidase CysQ [Rhodobacterales bacterium HKCCE4037]|nr:3'(2'),5'-bisphosphate nucleotidase CysQ [Rhodobacterales bacterium HKCCE4037]
MPGPEDDLALLISAAERAGEIAGRYFRQDPQIWDKGVDGPVTEADFEIDAMLRDTLLGARREYGWLSEETEDDPARLSAETLFICDPIDGTRAFIDGEPSFSHSLAVVHQGQVTAGVVFLPMRDKLYAAASGKGSTLNGVPVRVTGAQDLAQSTFLATKGALKPEHWLGGIPEINRAYRPSLAYRMSLVGEGRFDGMMTFRPTWEWDIAAGTLIIEEAGGRVTTGRGAPLVFNGPTAQVDGVLAGSSTVHGALVAQRR